MSTHDLRERLLELAARMQANRYEVHGDCSEDAHPLPCMSRVCALEYEAECLLREAAAALPAGDALAPPPASASMTEMAPSAWTWFGDGHDYSRTGKHDPLVCRVCMREEIARLATPPAPVSPEAQKHGPIGGGCNCTKHVHCPRCSGVGTAPAHPKGWVCLECGKEFALLPPSRPTQGDK